MELKKLFGLALVLLASGSSLWGQAISSTGTVTNNTLAVFSDPKHVHSVGLGAGLSLSGGNVVATGTNASTIGVNASTISTPNLQNSSNLIYKVITATNIQAVVTNVSPSQITGVIPTNNLAPTLVNSDRATTFTAQQNGTTFNGTTSMQLNGTNLYGIEAGSNITTTTNGGRVVITSTGGSSSSNLSFNGVLPTGTTPNVTNSASIGWSVTASNATASVYGAVSALTGFFTNTVGVGSNDFAGGAVLSTLGPIASSGGSAGYIFKDRTSGTNWVWYGSSTIARLYNGLVDIFSSDISGNTALRGALTAPSATFTNTLSTALQRWNASVPYVGELGTIANGGTATLSGTTNEFYAALGGATFNINLPASPTNGQYASLVASNSSGGTQIGTIQVNGTPTTLRTPWGTSSSVTNAASAVVWYQAVARNGGWLIFLSYGDAYNPAGSGGGTVTATGGSLTANSVPLGAGGTDLKVVAGIRTDGASVLALGVGGSSVGGILFSNATSGRVLLSPPVGALGSVDITLPAGSGTLGNINNTAFDSSWNGDSTAGPTRDAVYDYLHAMASGDNSAVTKVAPSVGITNAQMNGSVLLNQTTNNGTIRHTETAPVWTTTNLLWDLSLGNVQFVTLTNASAGLLYLTGFTNSTVQNGTWLLYTKQDGSGSRSMIITNSATTIGHTSQSITTYTNANGISLITLVGNPFTNGSYFFTLSTNL